MFAWRLLRRTSKVLGLLGKELHLHAAETAMDRSTRLLSWGHEKLAERLPGHVSVSPRAALTQDEIEAIARETRFFIPPIEAITLPSFADLAGRLEHACSCRTREGLRQRGHACEAPLSDSEQVCVLIGAMRDRFGEEARFLALLERLLVQSNTSPCVRRAAADALGSSEQANAVRRRALGQLRRRVEWEGRNPTQLDLIARLS